MSSSLNTSASCLQASYLALQATCQRSVLADEAIHTINAAALLPLPVQEFLLPGWCHFSVNGLFNISYHQMRLLFNIMHLQLLWLMILHVCVQQARGMARVRHSQLLKSSEHNPLNHGNDSVHVPDEALSGTAYTSVSSRCSLTAYMAPCLVKLPAGGHLNNG